MVLGPRPRESRSLPVLLTSIHLHTRLLHGAFFYSLDDFFLDEPEPGGGMLIPSYFLLEESYEEIVGRPSGLRLGIRVHFL